MATVARVAAVGAGGGVGLRRGVGRRGRLSGLLGVDLGRRGRRRSGLLGLRRRVGRRGGSGVLGGRRRRSGPGRPAAAWRRPAAPRPRAGSRPAAHVGRSGRRRGRVGRGRRGRRVGRAGGRIAVDRAGRRVARRGRGVAGRTVVGAVASASDVRPEGPGRLAALVCTGSGPGAATSGVVARGRPAVVVAGTVGGVAGKVGSVVFPACRRCRRRSWSGVGAGDEPAPGRVAPSGPEPVAGASGPVPVPVGRPGRPGRPIAGAPPMVIGCAAKDGRPPGWEAACGGASSLTGVRVPCVLGQASRNGRTSLRSSARQVPISAQARAAPASHAR